jgi:hypothetical protein
MDDGEEGPWAPLSVMELCLHTWVFGPWASRASWAQHKPALLYRIVYQLQITPSCSNLVPTVPPLLTISGTILFLKVGPICPGSLVSGPPSNTRIKSVDTNGGEHMLGFCRMCVWLARWGSNSCIIKLEHLNSLGAATSTYLYSNAQEIRGGLMRSIAWMHDFRDSTMAWLLKNSHVD